MTQIGTHRNSAIRRRQRRRHERDLANIIPAAPLREDTLLVSARRAISIRSDGTRAPYGPHHARRAGDPTTLCGLAAIEWTIFWEMRFIADHPTSCAECATVAATEYRDPYS